MGQHALNMHWPMNHVTHPKKWPIWPTDPWPIDPFPSLDSSDMERSPYGVRISAMQRWPRRSSLNQKCMNSHAFEARWMTCLFCPNKWTRSFIYPNYGDSKWSPKPTANVGEKRSSFMSNTAAKHIVIQRFVQGVIIACYAEPWISYDQVCRSVRLFVRHTPSLSQNDASQDHEIFTGG